MPTDARERRAARKPPITPDRITDAALEIVAAHGYEALTMRSIATALGTGPASLYAHVVNKADLDALIIGRLCSRIRLPEADPAHWRDQLLDVLAQLRDQYLQYPGISRAALAMVVTDLDVLSLSEGMLAITLAGGIDPQAAAWAIDAAFLYVGAYALEAAVVAEQSTAGAELGRDDRDAVVRRFEELPEDRFPQTRAHAAELTAGTGHERFDFTLGLLLDSLSGHRATAD